MGMNVGNSKCKRQISAEINVTPLVDVMLVLLIIFMVTTPMMTTGVDVKLPKTTSDPLPQKKQPVIISVTQSNEIYLNNNITNLSSLKRSLIDLKQRGETEQILLRGDSKADYGFVATVIAATREAGIENLGLVTEPADSQPIKGTTKKTKNK